MPPTATSPGNDPRPAGSALSGSLVIGGIVLVALIAAGTSWWYRYQATHRSAEFWGPHTGRLIRDGQVVAFVTFAAPIEMRQSEFQDPRERDYSALPQTVRRISTAPGLVHMRNALLLDASYKWPPRSLWRDTGWKHALVFSDGVGQSAYLLISPDLQLITSIDSNQVLSYQPIAEGLHQLIDEFSGLPADIEPQHTSPSKAER